jgi:hypothetical protein
MPAAIDQFYERLRTEWLPRFCLPPKRGLERSEFREGSNRVSELDAADFLRAIDSGVVVEKSGGTFWSERSYVQEQLVWQGLKRISPRPLTLWLEPVITIATLARLHLDYGWPATQLGMQSRDWAFDFAVYEARPRDAILIAGEVKKTKREVERLMEDVSTYAGSGATEPASKHPRHVNSYKKWNALRNARVPLIWAVGPNGYSTLRKISYEGRRAQLTPVPLDALDGPGIIRSEPST